MAAHGLRREERIGLVAAAALHVALVAALLLQPATRDAIAEPERMTVSLAEDVGLEATAPDPVAESRAAQAPTLDDHRAPAPQVERAPSQIRPEPRPAPPQIERPRPAPADTRPRRRPDPPRNTERPRPAERSGGSRLGDNFLEGAGDSTRTSETRTPASQIGASAKASLVQAIAREIKPHWQPPNGPDVDRITTYLRFRLNPDGSLAGRPEVVRQTGVSDTNRAQAGRHGELAVRAVQQAAPFDLPEEYYEAWKLVGPFGFDWKLAQ